ncbi:hypothetical protein C6N75_10015 [Streptomyces solincola]|uniref:Transglycosylase SLT domain-containing protein n=1 Tax=Streptomyces solincola TaxID=2100817 RepID=A0A2S9PYC0_9ACTN|nr:hypothetical protein C6N75_10015 [Streptomyces solincola]
MATVTSLGFSIFSRYDGNGVSQARRDIAGFRNELVAADRSIVSATRRFQGLQVAAVAIAPALLPVATVAAANAGALAAMGVSAGTALGVFGAAMGGAIKNTLSLRDSVQQLKANLDQQRATLATLEPGTEAYAKQLLKVLQAQQEYDAALRRMTPAQRAFLQSLDALTASWQRFISQTQNQSLGVATTVLAAMAVAVGKLKPLFDAVVPSMQGVANAIAAWLKGDGFERFIQVVMTQGVPSLNALIAAGRSMATVLGEAFRAFAPLGTELANSLARGAAELAKWSTEGGFIRFIREARAQTPAVREMLDALWAAFKNILAAMQQLAPVSMTLITVLAQIVAAIPPGVIAAIAQAFVAWRVAILGMMVIQGVAALFTAFVHVLSLLRGAVMVAITVWRAFNLAFIATPIGAVITAIVALVAAFVILWNKCEWFREFWINWWNNIKQEASTAWQWIQMAWNAVGSAMVTAWQAVSGALVTAWNATWSGISTAVQAIWTGLTTAWNAVVNGFQVVWSAVGGALSAAWSAVWGAIQVAATAVWNALQTGWQVFVGTLQTIWSAVGGALSAAWSAVWNAISVAATAIWSALQAAWSAFITGLQTIWSTVSGALSAAWSAVWNAISAAAMAVWNALQTAWSAFITGLQTIWSTVSGALSATWSAVWNAISAAATTIWSALQAAWSAFVSALQTVFSAVSGALSAAWSAFWSGVQSAAQTVWSALQAAWQAFLSALQSAYQTISSALSAAWSAFWSGLQTAAQAVWSAIQTAWSAVLTAMQTAWSAFSSALTAAWNAFWTAVRTAAQAVWTALQTAWSAFLTAIQTAYTTFSAALTAAWNLFWNAIRTAAQTIWTALQTAWTAFLNLLRTAYNTWSAALTAAWNAFWTALRAAAQAIWNALSASWQALLNLLRNTYNTWSAALRAAWQAFWTAVRTAAQTIWNAMSASWQALLTALRNAWNTFSSAIRTAWNATWNALRDIARTIWNQIGGIIERAINGVIGIVNALIKGFNNVTSFLSIDVKIGEIGTVNFPTLATGGIVTFAYGGMTGKPCPEMQGYAAGGPVNLRKGGTLRGYAPGKDTVPAILSKGEGVLTPEAVRGLGGPGFVNGANRKFAGHRGAGRGAPSLDKFGVPHFAVGGMTSAALARAGVPMGLISQGEYSHGSLSAGTHAGGGAVDISSTSPAMLARLHAAGFAAWIRGPEHGMSPHIHAVLMNHPELSGPARAQVASFRAGGSGLGSGGGGAGGGGGIPSFLQSILSKAGEILSRVAQGLPLGSLLDGLSGLFGGGGGGGGSEEKEDGGGLFGSGIGPDFGPDITPGKDLADAASKVIGGAAKVAGGVAGALLPDLGSIGKMLLGLIPDDAFEFAFKWVKDRLSGWGNPAGNFGKILIAMGEKVIKGAIDFLIGKNKEAEASAMAQFASFSVAGAQSVQSWAPLARQAMVMGGLDPSQLPAFLQRMQIESTGNPNAINNWDINARNGIPSQGLMQIIPPNFQKYHVPGTSNNILDPLANMAAAAAYIKDRYGGRVPTGKAYALGTPGALPGPALVGENGPEIVNMRGGDTVTPAKDTAQILSNAAAPALPPVPATGMPQTTPLQSPIIDQLKAAPEGEGWFGDIIAAAQHMLATAQTAWNGTVQAGVTATPAITTTTDLVGKKVGADIPAKLDLMAGSSQANWSAMNASALTNWNAMLATVFTPAEQHQGTTMPLTATQMNTASNLAWTNMNAQSAAQWVLMRDSTFTEAELHQGTTMPTMATTMQTASDTAWTTMNATSAEQWTGIRDGQVVPFETHMQTTMPEAATAMNEAVGAAFTAMVETIVAQLDTAIAKIEEFIAATEAAIAAAEALAAAQAAAASSGAGGSLGAANGSAAAALSAAGISSGMIVQGPYSNSVAASAGTHSGGGVYDIAGGPELLPALHAAGFAAWYRDWPGNQHIHAVYSGASDLSPQAQWQLDDFRRGGDGLGIPGGLASGTSGASRGWSWIGERGPELMKLRGGERIKSNKWARRYTAGAQRGTARLLDSFRPADFASRFMDSVDVSVCRTERSDSRPIPVVRSDGGETTITIPITVQGNLDHEAVREIENEVIPKLRSLMQQGVGKGR